MPYPSKTFKNRHCSSKSLSSSPLVCSLGPWARFDSQEDMKDRALLIAPPMNHEVSVHLYVTVGHSME